MQINSKISMQLSIWFFIQFCFATPSEPVLTPRILGPLLNAIKLGDISAGQQAALQLFVVLCIKTFVENQALML